MMKGAETATKAALGATATWLASVSFSKLFYYSLTLGNHSIFLEYLAIKNLNIFIRKYNPQILINKIIRSKNKKMHK